jgi:hypothetical protein
MSVADFYDAALVLTNPSGMMVKPQGDEIERMRIQVHRQRGDNPPRIKARAEVRQLAPREGWCYQHVQAIIVAIDQYAETALGDREFFLNKPYGIGGGMKDNIP